MGEWLATHQYIFEDIEAQAAVDEAVMQILESAEQCEAGWS